MLDIFLSSLYISHPLIMTKKDSLNESLNKQNILLTVDYHDCFHSIEIFLGWNPSDSYNPMAGLP